MVLHVEHDDPNYAGRGNNAWFCAPDLPHRRKETIEGVRFLMVHDRRDVPYDLNDVDVVVYGHSHQYYAEGQDGILWLNPGSCGRRRFGLGLSLCRMTVEQGRYTLEPIPLDSPC